VAKRENNERDRTSARRVQAADQDADRAAIGRYVWALLASGQINMRKVDGWQTLATKPVDQPIDLAAWLANLEMPEIATHHFQHNSRRHLYAKIHNQYS
jgi:hypothetical protein